MRIFPKEKNGVDIGELFMIYKITGKENKTLKMVKSLKKKSNRIKLKMFVAEGRRICDEALRYASDRIYCVILSQSFFDNDAEEVRRIETLCEKVCVVSDKTFEEISDTETPQGIMTVINIRENSFEPDDRTDAIVVLDGVSEPGNMGTVIRTAEALGFDALYIMKGSADIYSPKVVRATMGAVFRMKFKADCEISDITGLKSKGFSLIATTPGGDVALEKYSPSGRFAAIIGNEAHGISSEILDISDYKVKITMEGNAESFNAGVASGIVLHWLKVFGKKTNAL